ncbi:kelch-like protein 17 [Selaginella moellendorffii]|nr:kelch-like protein 17 [Selaginella moellendorffii]|eukprot:XP_002974117.2 kelch-like protein 17 [Selaginella moellendorffii]
MDALPDHILVQCLAWLPPQHQAAARLVCRRFHDLLRHGRALRYSLCRSRLEPWLCVLGGVQENKGHLLAEMYHPLEGRWRSLPAAPSSSCHNVPCVAFGGRLYVVGGFTGRPQMAVYDFEHNVWEEAAAMLEPREAFACGVIEGRIYVAGGLCRHYSTENARLRSAEVYHPEKNSWLRLPPMKEKRSCCASAVAGDKLYVIGGYSTPLILTSVEVFDPREGSWETCSEMQEPWIIVGCAAIGPFIYVVGSKFTEMDRLELQVYDTIRGEWEDKGTIPVSKLLHGARCSLWGSAVVAMAGNLYIAGGSSSYDGGGLDSVIVYIPARREWISLPQMRSRRHACAGAVIYL